MAWPVRNTISLNKLIEPNSRRNRSTTSAINHVWAVQRFHGANLAHQSMESALFRKSDLCLNCHQVVPVKADLGKSNDLLELGPKQGREVRKGMPTCHMPEQVGESANGEAKRKVANHTFPGRIGQLRQEAASWTCRPKWRATRHP